MKYLTQVKDLVKIIRDELITQSELPSNSVLNALSLYGTDLTKKVGQTGQTYEGISQTDTTLLFELTSKSSTSDVSEDVEVIVQEQNQLLIEKMFRVHIIIYGSSSSDVAMKIVARLRSENARVHLYDQGVYLSDVSDIHIMNEFKNNKMWLRNDFDIDIAAQFNISQVIDDDMYIGLGDFKIIKEGD